jgi:hypothetical protein
MNTQFNQIRVVKKRKDHDFCQETDAHVLYKILFSHIRELNNGCELSLMIFFIKRINGSYVRVRKVRVSLYILFF